MKTEPRKSAGRAGGRISVVIAALMLSAGCTAFMDQVEVPGTGQRLVVGHDGWPFKKAWVIENGTLHAVKIVRGDR